MVIVINKHTEENTRTNTYIDSILNWMVAKTLKL